MMKKEIMKTNPKKSKTDFYQVAIHFIFAIILAHAFMIATKIIIPFDDSFTSEKKFLQSLAFFVSFLIIIIGWTAYARSMYYRQHKDNFYGTIRFFLDIFVVFLYFYLLEIIHKDVFVESVTFVNLFIFGTFLVWDIFRYYEFKKYKKEHKKRMKYTIFAFIISIGIYISDLIFIQLDILEFKWYSNNYIIIGIGLFILIGINHIIYRINKWERKTTLLP